MKNLFKIVTVIVFLLSLTLISALDSKNKYIKVDDMDISWEIVDDNAIFTISAPTNGWVSIGFEPTKMMKDADIIIAYVKDGVLNIEDHYGNGNVTHKPDIDLGGEDNVNPVKGIETDKMTTVTFAIPLNSGDKYDKVLEEGKNYTIIFAYGKKDDFKSWHKYKSKAEITL